MDVKIIFKLFDVVCSLYIEWVAILNENTQIKLKALGEYAKHAKGW